MATTGGMREAKRKLPAERHGELLGRAVEISRADGLSAVTLRKVAADLGVTPGLVSHYFSSAEQLITAAFRTAATEERYGGRVGAGAGGGAGGAWAHAPSNASTAAMATLFTVGRLHDSQLWADQPPWTLQQRQS